MIFVMIPAAVALGLIGGTSLPGMVGIAIGAVLVVVCVVALRRASSRSKETDRHERWSKRMAALFAGLLGITMALVAAVIELDIRHVQEAVKQKSPHK